MKFSTRPQIKENGIYYVEYDGQKYTHIENGFYSEKRYNGNLKVIKKYPVIGMGSDTWYECEVLEPEKFIFRGRFSRLDNLVGWAFPTSCFKKKV